MQNVFSRTKMSTMRGIHVVNSLTLNCPIDRNQQKSEILFQKKSFKTLLEGLCFLPQRQRVLIFFTPKNHASLAKLKCRNMLSVEESTHSELRLPRRVLLDEILIGIRKYYSFDVHITLLNLL